jgi:hypothetical protein
VTRDADLDLALYLKSTVEDHEVFHPPVRAKSSADAVDTQAPAKAVNIATEEITVIGNIVAPLTALVETESDFN